MLKSMFRKKDDLDGFKPLRTYEQEHLLAIGFPPILVKMFALCGVFKIDKNKFVYNGNGEGFLTNKMSVLYSRGSNFWFEGNFYSYRYGPETIIYKEEMPFISVEHGVDIVKYMKDNIEYIANGNTRRRDNGLVCDIIINNKYSSESMDVVTSSKQMFIQRVKFMDHDSYMYVYNKVLSVVNDFGDRLQIFWNNEEYLYVKKKDEK